MSALIQDLRFGVRMLLRAPSFTALVLLTLALGVGANSAVFSIVNAVLLRPLPFADPASLYQVDEVNPRGQPSGVSAVDLDAFVQSGNVFSQAALSRWHNATITGPEGAENVYGAKIAQEMMPLLGVRTVLGRSLRPDEFRPGAPGAVLITDRLWKRRFARNPAVVGTQLMLNGEAHTIAGVLPTDFFLSQRYEYYIPWQLTAAEKGNREERWPCLVRLKPGATVGQARTALEGVFRSTSTGDFKKGWTVRITPVHDQVTARARPALLVILGAVAFVLLIACFNIVNLLLARGAGRTREMAIRAALGAGRMRVVRQLLTESAALALLGGLAGSILGAVAASAIVRAYPDRFGIPRLDQTRLDWAVLLFTLVLSVATGLIFGLVPALQAVRLDLQDALKQRARGSVSHSNWIRHGLVIAETALSLVLLVGAGLMLRSLVRLMAVDPGFKPDRVLTVRVPLPPTVTDRKQQPVYYARLLEKVAAAPGLNSVGLIAPLPLAGVDANSHFAVEGQPSPQGERQLVKLRTASPGYFRVMGVTLQSGRVFNESDTADAPQVALINQSLARRYFPGQDPIGKRVTMAPVEKGLWLEIVGVVNDIKALNLADKAEPELYRDYRQFSFAPFATTIVVRAQSAELSSASVALQSAIRAANPDQPVVDLLAMPVILSNNLAQPRFYTLLLGAFAAIALLLAAAGVYGVLSCSVNQRIRDIGIRIALGASGIRILTDVVGRAMILLSIGCAIGLAGAVALTRLLESQLYEVRPMDLPTFAAVTATLMLAGIAAAWIPARRAMRVDPNVALRCE